MPEMPTSPEWYHYISDGFINQIFSIVLTDYKVATLFVVGPVIWAIKKYTSWTPWTTDDQIVDMIKKRLGLGEKNEL